MQEAKDDGLSATTKIQTWCDDNGLMLNVKKSQELLVMFKRCNIEPLPNIPQVTTIKLLGVHIDQHLKFDTHINIICKRSKNIIWQINGLKRNGYFRGELEIIYNSLVLGTLKYGICVWGGISSSLVERINSVQRLARRLGIIHTFTPIQNHIREADERLLSSIYMNPGHPLKKFYPERSGYATERLRDRHPHKRSHDQTIFPCRVIKTF